MKYCDALVAYNPGTDQIQIGHLLQKGDADWTEPYLMTLGAAFVTVRTMSGNLAKLRVMSDFIGAVVRDGVDIAAAHRAFMGIDEYRSAIPADLEADSLACINTTA